MQNTMPNPIRNRITRALCCLIAAYLLISAGASLAVTAGFIPPSESRFPLLIAELSFGTIGEPDADGSRWALSRTGLAYEAQGAPGTDLLTLWLYTTNGNPPFDGNPVRLDIGHWVPNGGDVR